VSVSGRTIRGSVRMGGAVLPGITISLRAPTGQTTTATTDAQGTFTFPGLAPGQYQVTVQGAGITLPPRTVTV